MAPLASTVVVVRVDGDGLCISQPPTGPRSRVAVAVAVKVKANDRVDDHVDDHGSD